MDLEHFPRSFLYVPADRSDLYSKAASSGADAVILDLEDSVLPERRPSARISVIEALQGQPQPGDSDTTWWCRLDPDEIVESASVLALEQLTGVIIAKVDYPSLDKLATVLASSQRKQPVKTIGLIESAAAHVDLNRIVTHPILSTLGIGEVDLLADLNIVANDSTIEAITQLRLDVVRHCAAAGLRPPVAPTSTDFHELEAFRRSSTQLCDLGFGSRTAIHPHQVPMIHEGFTPDPASVAAAHDVIARLESAGGGVALDGRGRLIDGAVVKHALNLLARAR